MIDTPDDAVVVMPRGTDPDGVGEWVRLDDEKGRTVLFADPDALYEWTETLDEKGVGYELQRGVIDEPMFG